jgi:hypothetical protein
MYARITQIYINDIIFGTIHDSLSYKFVKKIKSKFKMNMIGELKKNFDIQIKHSENKIFIY